MTSKKVARQAPPRKSPGSAGAVPSKLLHDCPRCGRPVFSCRVEHSSTVARSRTGTADVEVLDKPTGDVAIQTQLGSDELAAVVISSPRTWYRFHAPHCKGAFSKISTRKVRS